MQMQKIKGHKAYFIAAFAVAIIGIILLIRDHIPSYKSALGHKTDNEDTNYPTAPHAPREEKSSPPLPFSREILLYAVLAALLCAFG